MQNFSKQNILFTLLILLVLTGCTSQPTQRFASASVVQALGSLDDTTFARATAPMAFNFPQDHGPHPEFRTEWWYYTGNLADETGNQFGYQLTFFRSALAAEMPERTSDLATNQFYMAHFAVTSGVAKDHLSFERFSRGAGGLAGAQSDPVYGVWLEDWAVKTLDSGEIQLSASAESKDGPVALDLTLRETRLPVLHGDTGLSQKGPESGNANYYYSLVNLETTGQVTFAGQQSSVTGLSWMDHEFGTSALSGDTKGWDWFAVQLDNGAVFMFGEFHNGQGGERRVYEGTLLYPDNRQVKLAQGDFVLEPLAQWTSPRTNITYPSGWRIHFPAYNIELEIEPLIDDQEMEVAFIYYEGATIIQGTMDGMPVGGRGYVELTGYGDNPNEYQR